MRITVDIDSHNPLRLMLCIAKGLFLFRKIPYKLTKTRKGFHIFWYNIDADIKKSLVYRYWLGDDRKRIEFDTEKEGKRIKQVMFKYKEVETITDRGRRKRIYREKIIYDLVKHKRGSVIEKLKEKNPELFR